MELGGWVWGRMEGLAAWLESELLFVEGQIRGLDTISAFFLGMKHIINVGTSQPRPTAEEADSARAASPEFPARSCGMARCQDVFLKN